MAHSCASATGQTPPLLWINFALVGVAGYAARITQLRERHAQQTGVTIDTVTEQLRRAYKLAMDRGQPGAAVAAAMALARLHGLIKKRAEARAFVVCETPEGLVVEEKPPEPMSSEEWMVEYGQPAS
jgi:hypothetical protein